MIQSDMSGFKILDKVIREERLEKRRPRAEPWDTQQSSREEAAAKD